MVLAIIFLVLFVACIAINLYQTISLVKTPMVEVDYKKHFTKIAPFVIGAVISLLVASFGLLIWARSAQDVPAPIDFLHVFELVIGSILFGGGLLVAINAFIIHYYGRNIPEKLDKWLFRIQLVSFIVAAFSFFIYTNGLAPYLHYPLVNGINFQHGFVAPDGEYSPNLAFYALCILSGAILVYFICDHYMYKEYGKHGILESTFFVAFPAGILGARLWFVIGEWETKFDSGRAMTYIGDMKIWAPLAIWEGGLTILGGAIMGIVVGVAWYLWRNKGKSIWFAVDMIVPTILIAQAVGRWGNFFNCEVHGMNVDGAYFKWLPEIVYNNATYSSVLGSAPEGQIYLPLFFIECFTNLFGYFLIAHVFGRALKKFLEPGDLCFAYVIWYGLTRVLLEPLRHPEFKMGPDGYWSWVWSMIFVAVGTLLIVINHIVRMIIKKKQNKFAVQPYDNKLGLISSIVIVAVGGALAALGIYLMSSTGFIKIVEYNGFNVGLIILILGASVLLSLGISLPILFNAIKQPVNANE